MRLLISSLITAALVTACAGSADPTTNTPYPTHTPYPTQTPYPTYTPQPKTDTNVMTMPTATTEIEIIEPTPIYIPVKKTRTDAIEKISYTIRNPGGPPPGYGEPQLEISFNGDLYLPEDLTNTVEQVTGIIKDPVGYISGVSKKLLKLKDKDKDKEITATKEEIKLELRIDGKKLLHWEGRWVPKYKAFFYQVLTSGYQPFHYYIVMQGRNPFAIQMKRFNRKIDLAVRKAKKKLAIEYDITEAQIDKIIEEQTGRATQEATQEAVKDAVSAEVEAAIAQSVGDAMSEGFVSAIEDATGEAIDNAIEQELAQAIDEAIAEAVSAGIEQAAVEAGFQAFFDTIAAGGTEAEAIAAADAACAAIDSGC